MMTFTHFLDFLIEELPLEKKIHDDAHCMHTQCDTFNFIVFEDENSEANQSTLGVLRQDI